MASDRTGGRRRSARGEGGQLADEIIAAAVQILDETGDESSLTLRGIARRLGITAPSIYLHFPNVHAIRERVAVVMYEQYVQAVYKPADLELPPAQRIRNTAAAYVKFARDRPQTYRVLFTRMHPIELPQVGDHARSTFAALAAALAAATPDRNPAENGARAVSLWLELHGIASLPPANPRFPWPPDDHMLDYALDRVGIPHPSPPEEPSGRPQTPRRP